MSLELNKQANYIIYDHDELFCKMINRQTYVTLAFRPKPLTKDLLFENLRYMLQAGFEPSHNSSKVWTMLNKGQE